MNKVYFLAILPIFISACTHVNMDENTFISDAAFVNISCNTKGSSSEPSELMLYVFSRNENHNSDYSLDSVIRLNKAYSRIKFPYARLQLSDYRFLFIKTPLTPDPEISVMDITTHQPPEKNCIWKNISIEQNTSDLSLNNYFALKDYTNDQLFQLDTIQVKLKRIVGQVLFNFPHASNFADNKFASTSSSVFDRIYKIEINYSGISKNVYFTSDMHLEGIINTSEINKQTIIPELTSFRAILPQTYLDTLCGFIGGQIKGKCFLPVQNRLFIQMKFYFYDTTPCCSIEHIHQTNCFQEKTVLLQVPVSSSANGLSIYPDTYTVNTAKIQSKRLIDIFFNSDIRLDLEWLTVN